MNKSTIAQSMNYGMGTVIIHKVFGEQGKKALLAAEKETIRLENMLSRFIPDSDISRINRFAGTGYERLSPDTYEVLSHAVEFSKRSQGSFDVTIGPLVNLWVSARDVSLPPEETRIGQAISLVDYQDLVLYPSERAAGLKRIGQSIELGGIGKGFAADKVLEVLKKHGITSAFTNFGGNVATIGAKPDGNPWSIGIQHPRQGKKLIGIVSVVGKSVVTSGDYQQYFTYSDGKRYHHILNPATGYPSESRLISVTIVADNSMTADALSTTLFVVGMERGIELLKSFPDTEAILIDINLQVYITKGLQDRFQAKGDIKIIIVQN